MTNNLEIHGFCEPRFEIVKDAFRRNFDEGMEVGASFAVIINSKYVIDIWGGAGGSAITMDLDAKLSIGYVMNKMRTQTLEETRTNKYHSDTRGDRLITAVFESLGYI